VRLRNLRDTYHYQYRYTDTTYTRASSYYIMYEGKFVLYNIRGQGQKCVAQCVVRARHLRNICLKVEGIIANNNNSIMLILVFRILTHYSIHVQVGEGV
jgi:hypothetical protein